MTTYLGFAVPYLFAALCCFAFTPASIAVGKRIGLIDTPNSRKVHLRPISRAGGLAIVSATMAACLIVLLVTAGTTFDKPVLMVLLASAFIASIGFIDDLLDLPSQFKLMTLLVASAGICWSGLALDHFTIGGTVSIELGALSWPATMLWIVAISVSINFIDGLDGLAAGVVAIAAALLAILAAASGAFATAVIAATLCGSLTAFLIFNFHPAKVFMGDSGSMFIGFLLATACLLGRARTGQTQMLSLPLLALAIPLIDTVLTFVRRSVIFRQPIFAAERGHIHHRLLDTGFTQKQAVLLIYGVTGIAALAALAVRTGSMLFAVPSLICFGLAVVLLFRNAGSTRFRETVSALRKNSAICGERRADQKRFDESRHVLRLASNFGEWWECVCTAAERLRCTCVELHLTDRKGQPRTMRWSREVTGSIDVLPVKATIPIQDRRVGNQCTLEAEFETSLYLENVGFRVALFSRLLCEHGLRSINSSGTSALGDREHALNASTPSEESFSRLDFLSDSTLESDETDSVLASLSKPRIAIVHDFLYTYGGAERVLEQMINVFPQADLFSLFDFLPEDKRHFLKGKKVTTSFLQRLPFAAKKHRSFLPLMPLAIEQLNVSAYDIVLSSSYVAAKGVITGPNQLHICYCHSPVRFAWDLQHQYLAESGLTKGLKSALARMILHYIRTWDTRTANGVDQFLTNSVFVAQRVQKAYRRDAIVLHPPVDTNAFEICQEKEDYYLTASRLVPYKRIDLIVEAFAQMPGRRLIVIGEGPEYEKIKAKATPNVSILGYQPFDRLKHYMGHAKAFVFAAEEDFGIVPVEAQACGTPVIAYGKGGAIETVVNGTTGLHFAEQSAASIVGAVERFELATFDPPKIRSHALQFSVKNFKQSFHNIVVTAWMDKVGAGASRVTAGKQVEADNMAQHNFRSYTTTVVPG